MPFVNIPLATLPTTLTISARVSHNMSERNGYLAIDGRRHDVDRIKAIIDSLYEHTRVDALTHISLEFLDIDEALTQIILDLFRACSLSNRQKRSEDFWKIKQLPEPKLGLSIENCTPNPFLQCLIEAAVTLDVFDAIQLFGTDDEQVLHREYHALLQQQDQAEDGSDDEDENEDDSVAFLSFVPMDVFGFRMKFTRRLCSLRLISLILSRDHIESLMFGIQTDNNDARPATFGGIYAYT